MIESKVGIHVHANENENGNENESLLIPAVQHDIYNRIKIRSILD